MQQVALQRSDARSILPFELESNDVYRYIVGGSDDETTDEELDLYEILMSKGRLDASQNHDPAKDGVYPSKNQRKSVADDDMTASCTDSSSWNGSFHDSFTTLPGEDSTSIQSTSIASIPLSPRRKRRGSFVSGSSSHGAAPSLLHGPDHLEDQQQRPQPPNLKIRFARRKHGSFLEASSTSCCLSEIVEEATEASAVSADEQDLAVVVGQQRDEETNRVRFGQVEIRYYNVTLDVTGGYGRNGSSVACPLTLDWSFCAETSRKPAALYGYSSYFRHAKPKPLTAEERRARLGVLHHIRLPQVKHWEYKSLLYQMANLKRQSCATDRWEESASAGVDRIPRMPSPRIGEKNALDYDLHERRGTDAMPVTWRRIDSRAPKVLSTTGQTRGMELPVVPMQWIDHDTTLQDDVWEPVPSVWMDLNPPKEEKNTEESKASLDNDKPQVHRLPSATLLWLSDTASPSTRRVEAGNVGRVKARSRPACSKTFRVVPFEELVSSKCDSKLRTRVLKSSQGRVPGSPSPCKAKRDAAVEWKRAPPLRSNFRVVPFDSIVTASCLRASVVDDELDALHESFANMDTETIHFDIASRRSAKACPTMEHIDWQRNLRSPSTMWWVRALPKKGAATVLENVSDQKWNPESMVWLEESTSNPDTVDLKCEPMFDPVEVAMGEPPNAHSPEAPIHSLGRCVDAPIAFPNPDPGEAASLASLEPLPVEDMFRSHPMVWLGTPRSKVPLTAELDKLALASA